MNDQELREMIRESIARHTGARHPGAATGSGAPEPHSSFHPSHVRFALLRSGDDDGACLIEPAVQCNHCGYCLSYGH
jgi:hypothetical protein